MYPVHGPCVAALAAPGFHRAEVFRAAPYSLRSCQTLGIRTGLVQLATELHKKLDHTEEQMLQLTESRRAYLAEMRALTTDAKGQEVLVGLDVEESVSYLAYAERKVAGNATRTERDRYLALHDKHELMRLAVLGAEIQLRDGPSIQ